MRWAIGLPLGIVGIVASIELSGAHTRSLLSPAPVLLVLGAAVCGFVAVRGVPATGRLLYAFVRAPHDRQQRCERLADVDLLERTTLLGACLGALWGGAEAVGSFHIPMQVGPPLAFALQSLVFGAAVCALVWLPWRQHLLPEHGPHARLPAREAWRRTLGWFGGVALLAVATSGAFPGTPRICLTTPMTLLMLAGATLPSLLAAPDAILCGRWTRTRSRWLADAMLCGGVLAVTSGVAHCFSVLDQPDLVGPGIAVAFASFAVPALGAGLTRLCGAQAGPDEPPSDSPSPHPAFAAIVFATLAIMVAFVVAVLQQAQSAD